LHFTVSHIYAVSYYIIQHSTACEAEVLQLFVYSVMLGDLLWLFCMLNTINI